MVKYKKHMKILVAFVFSAAVYAFSIETVYALSVADAMSVVYDEYGRSGQIIGVTEVDINRERHYRIVYRSDSGLERVLLVSMSTGRIVQ